MLNPSTKQIPFSEILRYDEDGERAYLRSLLRWHLNGFLSLNQSKTAKKPFQPIAIHIHTYRCINMENECARSLVGMVYGIPLEISFIFTDHQIFLTLKTLNEYLNVMTVCMYLNGVQISPRKYDKTWLPCWMTTKETLQIYPIWPLSITRTRARQEHCHS